MRVILSLLCGLSLLMSFNIHEIPSYSKLNRSYRFFSSEIRLGYPFFLSNAYLRSLYNSNSMTINKLFSLIKSFFPFFSLYDALNLLNIEQVLQVSYYYEEVIFSLYPKQLLISIHSLISTQKESIILSLIPLTPHILQFLST